MLSAAEQRLLTYLGWLTLLLGILIGFVIVLFVVLWHDTAPHAFISGVRFGSPAVEGPILWLLFGAIMITEWWRRKLRTRLQTIWPLARNQQASPSLYMLITGLFAMIFGVFLLVNLALRYPDALTIVWSLLVGGWLAALAWAAWYTWRRGKQPRAQL